MTISHRRRARRIGLVVGLTALSFGIVPNARAEPGQHPPYATGDTVAGPLPQEAFDDFASCPGVDRFPEIVDENGEVLGRAVPEYCVRIAAYDGEIKLGNTVAHVDPIEMIIGVNLGGYIVSADGGSGPAPVKIAGGILGMPELDPVFDATLGLLSVSATPQIGGVRPGRHDEVDDGSLTGPGAQFLGWLFDSAPWGGGDITINVPLSVKLNNTLFGDRCQIPEFNIDLTTGLTAPPPGIEPMSGDPQGDFRSTSYNLDGHPPGGTWLGPNMNFQSRVGSRFVDNTFEVPAAESCDLLVGDLLDQDAGLFDGLIGGVTGLPAPAGNNRATFTVDTVIMPYDDFLDDAEASPSIVEANGRVVPRLDFGGPTPVGTSVVQTLTVRSTGTHPMIETMPPTLTGSAASQYEVLSNSCAEQEFILPGDECVAEIRFTPTSPGAKSVSLNWRFNGHVAFQTQLRGVGV